MGETARCQASGGRTEPICFSESGKRPRAVRLEAAAPPQDWSQSQTEKEDFSAQGAALSWRHLPGVRRDSGLWVYPE